MQGLGVLCHMVVGGLGTDSSSLHGDIHRWTAQERRVIIIGKWMMS